VEQKLDTIDKILNLMGNADVSAYQLSKETGIANNLVSQWKQHKQNPSIKSIKKVAKYFNVPWETLMPDDEESDNGKRLNAAEWNNQTQINNINFFKEYFNESEFRYILKMRRLNYKGVQKVLSYIDDLYGNTEYREDKGNNKIR